MLFGELVTHQLQFVSALDEIPFMKQRDSEQMKAAGRALFRSASFQTATRVGLEQSS
jgi:hypothetical protein